MVTAAPPSSPDRGDIVWLNFDPQAGHEQAGRRPALILSPGEYVGTLMELFKTSHGSWIYPEHNLLRIGGVPLFSGFMYASIGSFIARIQRLLDIRFEAYPPLWAPWD